MAIALLVSWPTLHRSVGNTHLQRLVCRSKVKVVDNGRHVQLCLLAGRPNKEYVIDSLDEYRKRRTDGSASPATPAQPAAATVWEADGDDGKGQDGGG